jgi:NAD(P)H-hydrate epimerase
MRSAEERAVACGSVTIGGLMDRAGHALAAEVARRMPAGDVVALCGPGNNGGDGWVAARMLARSGRVVRVLTVRAPDELGADARAAAADAVASGVPWLLATDPDAAGCLTAATVIIDALFGFGLRGPVREPFASLVAQVDESDAFVVAADVPSGVDPDSGEVDGVAISADVTVTFSALKPGLLIGDGAACAGEVVVADLGIDPALLSCEGAVELPGASDIRRIIPLPRSTDHKGSRGRVAVVAGSVPYPGAAVLATGGALRMGAGYVYVITPDEVAAPVLATWPSAIVRRIAGGPGGSIADVAAVVSAVEGADAVVVGPGVGTGDAAPDAVRGLLDGYPGRLLLDADALNVLAESTGPLRSRIHPTVITPHPGEAARLLGMSVADVVHAPLRAAELLSGPHLVCLLKGPVTVVAGGGRAALVSSGGPELARAGTGDVLAGMIGALLAQGVDAFDAAVAGAHLHGRAGAHGAARLTATSLVASDLPHFIPDAVREVAGG